MSASRSRIQQLRARRVRALCFLVALLVPLIGVSAPASATIIDRNSFTESYSYTNWDCGYAMDVAGVDSHRIHVRVDRRFRDIVFVTDNYDFSETWTGRDGRWFTFSGNGIAKDVQARHISGTLYRFTFRNNGQPFVITDPSGKVISRDRGSFSFSYTIDFADGSFNFLGVKFAGPHPLAFVDMCKVVAPLTGTDSAQYLTPRPIGSTSFPMGFDEYLPPSYRAVGAKSPLLLVFNGYGENGDGTPGALQNLLGTGIPRFIYVGGWPTSRPLVVLALQHVEDPPFDFTPCDGVPWGGSCSMFLQDARNHLPSGFCTTPDEVHDFIAYALAHYNVDPTRVYITGLSCGAFGGWEYLAKYGGANVAAAVLVAGDGRPAWSAAGCGLGATPIWAIAGELDDVVNPLGSIDPITNLHGCGVPANQARLTIYPGLYHDGWNQAYSGSLGDDIYGWMLGFSKP